MNIDIQSTNIQLNFKAQGADEIHQNLKILYSTPAGTVPLDRDFGININFLDEPFERIRGRLIIEYIEKTRTYEPRATVERVTFEEMPAEGKIKPKVVIKIEH